MRSQASRIPKVGGFAFYGNPAITHYLDRKGFRCAPCHGNGALCFSTCHGCGRIVLICDEVSHVYPNPHDLNQVHEGWLDDEHSLCPGCDKAALTEFRDSTADEIDRIGFGRGDYASL